MNDNAATVMAMYEAFGRGDIESILGSMSEDIAFDQGIRDTGLAYLQPGVGTDHVREFFGHLGRTLEYTVFEPGEPCVGTDTVMVPIVEEARNLRTGAMIPRDTFVHLWRFGSDGKAKEFRHIGDFATHERAAKAAKAAKAPLSA